jgi:hypothetical protein
MQSLQRAGKLLRQLSLQAEALAMAAAPAGRMVSSAAETSAMPSAGMAHRLGGAEARWHGCGAAVPAYARSFGSSSLRSDDDDGTVALQSDTFGNQDTSEAATGAHQLSALEPQAIADACGAAEPAWTCPSDLRFAMVSLAALM